MVEIDDKFKADMLNRDEKLETFSKHGITEDYLIGKLKDELEAADESQRKVQNGEETKTIIVKKPIWKIQQDARKDAHKLRGDYPAEQHQHSGDVIFHSNVPEPDMPKEEKKEPAEEEKPAKIDSTNNTIEEGDNLYLLDPDPTPSEFEK